MPDNYLEHVQLKLMNFDIEKKQQWEQTRQPYAAHFEVTPKCNMTCIHCYLQKHHDSKELSYDEIIEIIDILYNKGVLFLTLTGGEIFTRKDFMDIYLYAKKKGFLVELFTNGLLLTDEIISVLQQYPPLLIDISLYGSCEATYKRVTGISGAFEKIIENCSKLVAANIRIALKSPILTYTLPEIGEMKRIAKQLGVVFSHSYEIIATIDKDEITKQYQVSAADMLKCEFEDFYKRDAARDSVAVAGDSYHEMRNSSRLLFNCKIGRSSFVVDYNGMMCPCMKFRHKSFKLTNDTFDSIWEKFKKYTQLIASDSYKCASCDAAYFCEVCPAEMDFLYGDMEFRPGEACKYANARKAFYKEDISMEEAIALLQD